MVKKNKFNFFLKLYLIIIFIISISEFSRYNFFLSLPLFIYLFFDRTRFDYQYFKLFNNLFIIAVIGFLSGFINIFGETSFFLKDLLYFLQPIIFLLIGVFLCNSIYHYVIILKISVFATFIFSIYAIINLINDPSVLLNLNIVTRYENATSNVYAVITLAILLFAKKQKFKLFHHLIEKIIFYISILVVLTSLSRTYYLLLFVLFLVNNNYFFKKILKYHYFLYVIIFFVLFANLFITYTSVRDEAIINFYDKFLSSISEFTIRDYKTSSSQKTNWRGYEAYLGLNSYYNGNFFQYLFGKGFGTYVKVPYSVFSGEKTVLDNIPFFHNGFVTIILKTGFIGLVMFIIFINKSFNILKTNLNNLTGLNTFLTFLILFIAIQTFVVHGIYQTSTIVITLILFGATFKVYLKNSI